MAAAAVVDALIRALELRDYRRGKFAETREHAERVTPLAVKLASKVAPELLQDPRFEYGCRLHDIGMLASRRRAPEAHGLTPASSTRSGSIRGSVSGSSRPYPGSTVWPVR